MMHQPALEGGRSSQQSPQIPTRHRCVGTPGLRELLDLVRRGWGGGVRPEE